MEAKEKKIMIWVGATAVLAAVSIYFLSKASAASKTSIGSVPKPPLPQPQTPTPNPTPTPVVTDNIPFTIPQLADALEAAFQGYGTGWDNGDAGGVTGVFSQIHSDADFDALNRAYGQRKINSGLFNIFSKDYVGDMNGALKSELSQSEIDEINIMLGNQGVNRKIQ